jgi:hypothetical protein
VSGERFSWISGQSCCPPCPDSVGRTGRRSGGGSGIFPPEWSSTRISARPQPNEHELALGWIGHYAVGILYGILLIVFTGQSWLAAPTFLPAWILGIATVGAGWFLLQPGLGLGWAASKLPNANRVRALNLVSHTIFAAGMFGTALLMR